MSNAVIDLPIVGKITPTEAHSAVLGFVVMFAIGATRASSQVRREPWYFAGLGFVGLVVGVEVDRRTQTSNK